MMPASVAVGLRLVEVTSDSGHSLEVRRTNGLFAAVVSDPAGHVRFLGLYARTARLAIESAVGFVRDGLKLPGVAVALRVAAEAELRT